MVIGVDFDNTIVCYDDLFHRIAVEQGLVPARLEPRKNEVRDFLRNAGQEAAWTELQGYVYGPGMAEAPVFPGAIEFFVRAVRSVLSLYTISHKTRNPVVGPAHDLHQAARDWLGRHGFFDRVKIGLPPERVFFGATRREKIDHIIRLNCTHFIDDLEETFLDDSFPRDVEKMLFTAHLPARAVPGVKVVSDWAQIQNYVFDATN